MLRIYIDVEETDEGMVFTSKLAPDQEKITDNEFWVMTTMMPLFKRLIELYNEVCKDKSVYTINFREEESVWNNLFKYIDEKSK